MWSKKQRDLVRKYKHQAKLRWYKYSELKRRKKFWPLTKNWFTLRRKHREELKRWKAEIKAIDDKSDRRARKKAYKYYKKLMHRRVKWTVLIIIFLAIVWLICVWYQNVSAPLTPAQQDARDASLKLALEEQAGGSVLLRNVDSSLPLTPKSKVNVFGAEAAKPIFGGGGAGGIASTSVVDLYDALRDSGFKYNTELYNIYSNYAYHGKASDGNFKKPGKNLLETFLPNAAGFIASPAKEMPVSKLSGNALRNAVAYSDTAIYVVSRMGTETKDLSVKDLQLTTDEVDTIKTLDKNFKNVVLLLNTTNPIELGIVNNLQHVNSVLWIGAPGETGMKSVAKILNGEINPSGRLADTYAYDLKSNPAVINSGSFQYKDKSGEPIKRYFIDYKEGVYVGYRYYETFVPDAQYASVVQYPFGYGLSYTNFKWQMVGHKVSDGSVMVDVKVINTGEASGRDVVELYYTPPYIKGGVEKSAVNLAAYGKTSLLRPGESEIVSLKFDLRDMASYDAVTAKAYVLDAGKYTISVRSDAHRTVSAFTYSNPKQIVFDTDAVTGNKVTNRFDSAGGGLTYLSRQDGAMALPTSPAESQYTITKAILDADYKHKKSNASLPVTGAGNGLKLADLKGLDYNDPQWNKFLDQFTEQELIKLAGDGGYWSVGFEDLGIPRTQMFDGPASIRSFIHAWASVAYPIPLVLSSTWDTSLASDVGKAMGVEAQSYNVDAVYAPSINLHRSPLGGRAFEYYSEDPLLTGSTAVSYVSGLQTTNTMAVMKHFVANDQETHRADYGLYTWLDEQSLRELYLKPFQMVTQQAHVHGVMSAFNRIGAIWAGGDKVLLTDVLRGEWGFEGFVITDAGIAGQGDHFDALQAVEAGNDLMLSTIIEIPGGSGFEKQLKSYLKEDRAGTLVALRNAAHNICFYVLQTSKM